MSATRQGEQGMTRDDAAAFLPPDEQRLYDSIVHGLRSQGWSRSDAEAEAIDRIVMRRATPSKGTPNV